MMGVALGAISLIGIAWLFAWTLCNAAAQADSLSDNAFRGHCLEQLENDECDYSDYRETVSRQLRDKFVNDGDPED